MASASQAMQVGLQRRVTVHHWLNLFICLGYISLTGWWFIWALRKSWPSVSDQFSFTWPATDLEEINRSASAPAPSSSSGVPKGGVGMAKLRSENSTKPSPSQSQVKEHYSLWSPGFNALYVIHRTVAILYYFIYLRATFLVLNTPAMNKFIERKKSLVEKFEEAKKYAMDANAYDDSDSNRSNQRSRSSNTRRRLTSSKSFPVSSTASLGLDEYLFDKAYADGYFLEKEGKKKSRKGEKRQILWADDGDSESRIRQGDKDDDDEPEPTIKPKPKKRNSKDGKRSKKKEGRRQKDMSEEEQLEADDKGSRKENLEDDENQNRMEEVRPNKRKNWENRSTDASKTEKPPKPQPRERLKQKSRREASEEDHGGGSSGE